MFRIPLSAYLLAATIIMVAGSTYFFPKRHAEEAVSKLEIIQVEQPPNVPQIDCSQLAAKGKDPRAIDTCR